MCWDTQILWSDDHNQEEHIHHLPQAMVIKPHTHQLQSLCSTLDNKPEPQVGLSHF